MRRAPFLPIFAFAFSISVLASLSQGHPQLAVLLEGLSKRIAANPDDWDLRARRAWLQIDHGSPDSAKPDIAALMRRKPWKGEALFLEAWRLVLVGKPKEARGRILESLKLKSDAERYRILARIELALKKDDAALAAAEKAFRLGGSDEDQLQILLVHQARGRLPREVWNRTLDEYPGHPAIMEALFGFCLKEGKGGNREAESREPSLKSCDELTALACGTWWPESVDWRVNRARVLLAEGRGKETKPLLAEALEKLDDSRAGGDSEHARSMRKEIFDLMKVAKGK